MIEIRQAVGGYIIKWNQEYVFVTFGEAVQWMARHFSETQIGQEWKP